MPFTTAICNDILSLYFGDKTSLSSGSTDLYLALCTNDPEADNGSFNELSGNNYERVWLATKNANARWPVYMADPVGRSVQNQEEIHFNKATPAAWSTANGFGIFNDEAGGTLLYYAKLDDPISCAANDVVVFDPGDLKIAFATEDVAEASTT